MIQIYPIVMTPEDEFENRNVTLTLTDDEDWILAFECRGRETRGKWIRREVYIEAFGDMRDHLCAMEALNEAILFFGGGVRGEDIAVFVPDDYERLSKYRASSPSP